MDRRWLIALMFAALGIVGWLALHEPQKVARTRGTSARSEESAQVRRDEPRRPPPLPLPFPTLDAPSPRAVRASATVIDRRGRDELRRKLGEARRDAGRDEGTGAGEGSLEPGYVQERIHEDFLPLARSCHESARARKPKLDGTIVMRFSLVADPRLGGVVESAEIVKAASTIDDRELSACVRESMLAMSFAPPRQGGTATVTYPFTLSPGDPTDAGTE